METWTNTCGLPLLFNFEPFCQTPSAWFFPGYQKGVQTPQWFFPSDRPEGRLWPLVFSSGGAAAGPKGAAAAHLLRGLRGAAGGGAAEGAAGQLAEPPRRRLRRLGADGPLGGGGAGPLLAVGGGAMGGWPDLTFGSNLLVLSRE